jgi:hypothetical protein
MKTIPLSRGLHALVDDDDFDFLNQWRWYADKYGYAVRNRSVSENTSHKQEKMHRVIMGVMDDRSVDHINGATADNRKSNLRIAVSHALNCANQQKHVFKDRTPTSRFKGVYFRRDRNKWVARIKVMFKQINLGHFDTEIEAAQMYDEAAYAYWGEYARLNMAGVG